MLPIQYEQQIDGMITDELGKYKDSMMVNSVMWTGWQNKIGTDETAFFSGLFDDITVLTPVANFVSTPEATKKLSDLCLTRQRQDLIVIAHCTNKAEQARIMVAKLCLYAAERKEKSWLDTDAERATFQQSDDLCGVYTQAVSAINAVYTYSSMERPLAIHEDETVARILALSQKVVEDGREMIKLIVHGFKSRWYDTMKAI